MRFRLVPPPPDLADLASALWSLEGEAAPSVGPPILPDGSAELILHLGNPLHRLGSDAAAQPEAFVFGQIRHAIRLADPGHSLVLAVRFTPAGLFLWRGWDASELDAREHPLRALLGADEQPPLDALRAAGSFSRRIDLLCRWLRRLRRSSRSGGDLPLVSEAARRLASATPRITTLARELGVSRRRLERRFQQAVGLAPAEYARLLRVQRAAEALLSDSADLASLALAHGFADQAHFTRRFVDVVGTSPARYRTLYAGG